MVAKIRAPQSRAISSAAPAAPPPAPWMRTVSPGRTAARPTTIRQAVWYTSGNAAASTKERPRGIGNRLRAGTTAYSANVPATCSPTIRKVVQRLCSPARQYSQVVQ